jgi:hypothetical protein
VAQRRVNGSGGGEKPVARAHRSALRRAYLGAAAWRHIARNIERKSSQCGNAAAGGGDERRYRGG